MRLTFAFSFLIALAAASTSFAEGTGPVQPAAAETTVEDTTPGTTYGSGCPFDGHQEASTEEVVS